MYLRRIVLAASFCLGYGAAFAQSEPTSRNATAQDIEGNWQLLPLPAAIEPKILNNPWPAECQWYSYAPAGALKSIDQLHAPCNTLSSSELDETLTKVPAVVTWKYDLSPTYRKGVILVTRSDVKGYQEVWDPQIVVKAFSNGGVGFRQGDLLLYLYNLHSHQMVWIRHLRKLN